MEQIRPILKGTQVLVMLVITGILLYACVTSGDSHTVAS